MNPIVRWFVAKMLLLFGRSTVNIDVFEPIGGRLSRVECLLVLEDRDWFSVEKVAKDLGWSLKIASEEGGRMVLRYLKQFDSFTALPLAYDEYVMEMHRDRERERQVSVELDEKGFPKGGRGISLDFTLVYHALMTQVAETFIGAEKWKRMMKIVFVLIGVVVLAMSLLVYVANTRPTVCVYQDQSGIHFCTPAPIANSTSTTVTHVTSSQGGGVPLGEVLSHV